MLEVGKKTIEKVQKESDVAEIDSNEMRIHIRIEKKIIKLLDHELGDTRDMFSKMEETMSSLNDLVRRVHDCENVLFKTNIDGRRRLFEGIFSKIELIDS